MAKPMFETTYKWCVSRSSEGEASFLENNAVADSANTYTPETQILKLRFLVPEARVMLAWGANPRYLEN